MKRPVRGWWYFVMPSVSMKGNQPSSGSMSGPYKHLGRRPICRPHMQHSAMGCGCGTAATRGVGVWGSAIATKPDCRGELDTTTPSSTNYQHTDWEMKSSRRITRPEGSFFTIRTETLKKCVCFLGSVCVSTLIRDRRHQHRPSPKTKPHSNSLVRNNRTVVAQQHHRQP